MECKSDQQSIGIRRLNERDGRLLYEFFCSLSASTKHFFTPHRLDYEYMEFLTTKDIHNPDTRRYVVTELTDDGELIIGYFFFWEWLKKIPWFGIGIRDGYHGLGLGSKMMDYAIEDAKQHSKGGIFLITKKDNLSAQKLYKKFGYEVIGEEPHGQHLLVLNFPDDVTCEQPKG